MEGAVAAAAAEGACETAAANPTTAPAPEDLHHFVTSTAKGHTQQGSAAP